MDFKISSGSGKQGKCPECGKKLLNMLKAGVRQTVCSCGFKQILTKYPQNSIDTNQIELR